MDEVVEAPIVLLAAPWTRVQAILAGIRSWDQRILIDATNHFLNRKMELADLNGRSSSQLVAEWAPGARVVKALNTLYATDLAAGARVGKDRRVAFLSGDDASAKTAVGAIISAFGFAVIDLGSLAEGGRIQQAGGPLVGLELLLHEE